jgi:HEAT repeat protein
MIQWQPAVEPLVAILRNPANTRSERELSAAEIALSRFGASAVPQFIPLLSHPDAQVRAHAAAALGAMKALARDALPALKAAQARQRDIYASGGEPDWQVDYWGPISDIEKAVLGSEAPTAFDPWARSTCP